MKREIMLGLFLIFGLIPTAFCLQNEKDCADETTQIEGEGRRQRRMGR